MKARREEYFLMKIHDGEGFPNPARVRIRLEGLAFADVAKVDIPANLSNPQAWRAKVAARPFIAG